jgi:hypothetical protein
MKLGVANPAWDSLFCDDESDDKSSAEVPNEKA